MSGKPAARITDLTAHGGKICTGEATVLIGDRPAARVADDHICRPGHRDGAILPPCAATVLIGNRPAARVGDLTSCRCGRPVAIVSGDPSVLIGDVGGSGVGLAAGTVRRGKLWLRFDINPARSVYHDHRFIVESTDGSYRQARTIAQDMIPGDEHLDLEYTGLDETLAYCVMVQSGTMDGPRYLLRNVPYTELDRISRGGGQDPRATVAGAVPGRVAPGHSLAQGRAL